MNWQQITNSDQLNHVNEIAKTKTVFILKHSTRCSISSSALNRIERNWQGNEPIVPYYLDLIAYRNISNQIAEMYKVEHQSPQILVIKNGKCVYSATHFEIEYDELLAQA